MGKYRITIDGKVYEMQVELVEEDAKPQPAQKKEYKEFRTVQKDANVNVVEPSHQKQTVNNTGAVAAPMPGTVIRIEKPEGSAVKKGDLVLILEAMKMENEILSPADGTVTNMYCEAGGTVAGGDVLFQVK
ncbi:MAG: acetyl-CoA carboxylase biotin carboxyl carrier protein subunit [Clostridia bacterium]|nr:acetyl-CoA carboxylase biotin carboxyl carrier protein subunit [Clostridia bacterium]